MSLRNFGRSPASGLTVIDLLVALALSGIVAVSAGAFYVSTYRTWSEDRARQAAQANLRSVMDTLVRDIRLAGACTPAGGTLTPILGADGGAGPPPPPDSITLRINVTCIQTTLEENMAAVGDDLEVDPDADAAGFTASMRAYIQAPIGSVPPFAVGGSGEFFTIDEADDDIDPLADLTARYPQGSGVYRVEERAFAVATTAAACAPVAPPCLTLALDGAAPRPYVSGIEDLQIRYRLIGGAEVDAGATELDTTVEWFGVRGVKVTATARSLKTIRGVGGDGFYRQRGTVVIKPRNLL